MSTAWADALQAIAGSDLLFWARHDDSAAPTVLADDSGNNRDGTITPKAATYAAPVAGDGHSVDWGTHTGVKGGYASVPDGGWADPSNGFTVGTWLDINSIHTHIQMHILSKEHGFSFFLLGSGLLAVTGYLQDGTPTGESSRTGNIAFTGGRHFLTLTVDADALCTIGGVGIQRASLDGTSFSFTGRDHAAKYDATKPLIFGDPVADGAASVWGKQDETFVIGRALTEAEVYDLYLAGVDADMTFNANVPRVTGSFEVTVDPMVTFDAELTPVTGDFVLAPDEEIELDAQLTPVTGHFGLTKSEAITLDAQLTPVTASFTLAGAEIQLHGLVEVDAHFDVSKGPTPIRRWVLYDPVTDESYTFPINPNAMTPITRQRELKHVRGRYGVASSQQPKRDQTLEFSGVIRSQAFYDAMVLWAEKGNALLVTDHVGRVFRVYVTDFVPVDRSPIPRAPKRWKYTVKTRLLETL